MQFVRKIKIIKICNLFEKTEEEIKSNYKYKYLLDVIDRLSDANETVKQKAKLRVALVEKSYRCHW